MSNLIGIHGKKRSGKDTLGKFIANFFGPDTHSFAAPVKRATSEMFRIPLDKLLDGPEREEIDPFWGISPREMLQIVGTDCARNVIRDDIWIKNMESIYTEWNSTQKSPNSLFIITDVRFDNEADWVRANGGTVVHVERPLVESSGDTHESEQGIRKSVDDVVISNDTTLIEFYNIARDFLARDFGRFIAYDEMLEYSRR